MSWQPILGVHKALETSGPLQYRALSKAEVGYVLFGRRTLQCVKEEMWLLAGAIEGREAGK